MFELITISGVRGRLDANGSPELNLEDVARGLGFTQRKGSVEYVRWERVSQYLASWSFPTSGESRMPEFIPENIFYKLCFKAENEVAQKFQDIVTDEVLPAIRKHGAYLTPEKIEEVLFNPDTIIAIATQLKEERQKRVALEATVAEQRPKVLFADAVSVSETTILVGQLAKFLKQNGIDIGQNRLSEWLRENGYLIRRRGTDRNFPTQRSLELGLFEVKETAVSHSDGHVTISCTPRVTGKGQQYFLARLMDESHLAVRMTRK